MIDLKSRFQHVYCRQHFATSPGFRVPFAPAADLQQRLRARLLRELPAEQALGLDAELVHGPEHARSAEQVRRL